MRQWMLLALGGVFLAQMSSAQEVTGDAQAGRKLAMQCRTCHGIEGHAKMPIVPHIGGENPAYIEHQLTAFRDGLFKWMMYKANADGDTNAFLS